MLLDASSRFDADRLHQEAILIASKADIREELDRLASHVAQVERLIALGATRYPWRYRPGVDFVVLQDPDGNLFCVVQTTSPI